MGLARVMMFRRSLTALVSLLAVAVPPAAASRADLTAAARLELAGEQSGLRPEVLRSALAAYARVRDEGRTRRELLTVIDYTLPSTQRRLWVLDLAAGRVLAQELVAHGRGSGEMLAERFSNRLGSLQSSLGTFLTGGDYRGRHGRSLRLLGLDRGLNDQAESRAIVIHGADYVSDEFVRRVGRLGRSQGCPAVNPAVVRRLIDLIRDGTVVYAYYAAPRVPISAGDAG